MLYDNRFYVTKYVETITQVHKQNSFSLLELDLVISVIIQETSLIHHGKVRWKQQLFEWIRH